MIESVINGHRIEFYSGIEDLPIVQYHRYSKYCLVECGVGDSLADIDQHISKVVGYLDNKEKAYKELLNLRQNLAMVLSEQDIHTKSTLCLVYSVDGAKWDDFTDNGLDKLYNLVKDAKYREFEAIALKVRKAIDDDLKMYFPKVFSDSGHKNVLDLLRKRALLQVDSIVNGSDNANAIAKVTNDIYEVQNVKVFFGEENEEIKFDKQFADMCLLMSKEFGGDIKRYTTMEFYTAFERLDKQNAEIKKLKNKRR